MRSPLRAAPTAALMAAVLAFALLSGCTLPDEEKDSSGGGVVADESTYTLTFTRFMGRASPHSTQDSPEFWPAVNRSTEFQFTMVAEGSVVLESDHVGGHWAANKSDTPSTTTYPGGCTHIDAKLPGTAAGFTITCLSPPEPGLYHIRGHARIAQGDGFVNWWTGDLGFRVT